MIRKFKFEVLGALLSLVLGMLSGFLSSSGNSIWYQSLHKPLFQPPSWLFGPVWTILYILIGITGGRIWHMYSRSIFNIFIIQMILNLIWSPLFFFMHRIDLALIDICLLWLNLLILIVKLGQQGILLVPYLIWISFALVLNYQIYLLN